MDGSRSGDWAILTTRPLCCPQAAVKTLYCMSALLSTTYWQCSSTGWVEPYHERLREVVYCPPQQPANWGGGDGWYWCPRLPHPCLYFFCGSVTARIGFSIDSDLHEKLLRRIGSRWCKNHVESDLYVFVSVHSFCCPFRMNLLSFKNTESDITWWDSHIKSDLCCM
jgi:hypothetical protein